MSARFLRRAAAFVTLILCPILSASAQPGLVTKQRAHERLLQAAERRTEAIGYLNHIARAQLALEHDDSTTAAALLDACSPRLRQWEWQYLRHRCDGSLLTFRRHDDSVTRLAYSPDGKRLASAGRGGAVKVWDAATGRVAFTLHGHTAAVSDLAFRPDGAHLLTAETGRQNPLVGQRHGSPGVVRVWDAASGKALLTCQGIKGLVWRAEYATGGKEIAAFTQEVNGGPGALYLCSAETGKLSRQLTLSVSKEGRFTLARWQPGAERFVLPRQTEKRTTELLLCDATTGKTLRTFPGHTDWLHEVQFRPDGKQLASAGTEFVKIWDTETGRELFSWRHGQRLSLEEGNCRLGYTAEGSRLVVVARSRAVVLDPATGREVFSIRLSPQVVRSLAVRPDGRQCAVALLGDLIEEITNIRKVPGVVQLWDLERDSTVSTFTGHKAPVITIAFNSDGSRLAAATNEGTVRLWDAVTGREVSLLAGNNSLVRRLGFSSDGKKLCVIDDKEVRLWDINTRQVEKTLALGRERSRSLALRSDLGMVATGGHDRIALRDLQTNKEMQTAEVRGNGVLSLAFSADGRWLVSGHGGIPGTYEAGDATLDNSSPGAVVIWDTTTGKEVRRFTGLTGYVWIYRVAFRPDGKTVAADCADHGLAIWDATTGKLQQRMPGRGAEANGLTFSPEGRRLLVTRPRVLEVWDLTTGQQVLTLPGTFSCLALSPDGRRVATANGAEVRILESGPVLSEGQRRERQAQSRVEALLDQGLLRAEVRERLKGDQTLTRLQRDEAFRAVETTEENAEALYTGSWQTVRVPGRSEAERRTALSRLEAACRLDPGEPRYLKALGVAHYRLGKFAEAVKTLERSARLLESRNPRAIPEEQAFLAMAYHRLGDAKKARDQLSYWRATLRHLEELVAREEKVEPATAEKLRQALQLDSRRALLREAETLLGVDSKKSERD